MGSAPSADTEASDTPPSVYKVSAERQRWPAPLVERFPYKFGVCAVPQLVGKDDNRIPLVTNKFLLGESSAAVESQKRFKTSEPCNSNVRQRRNGPQCQIDRMYPIRPTLKNLDSDVPSRPRG